MLMRRNDADVSSRRSDALSPAVTAYCLFVSRKQERRYPRMPWGERLLIAFCLVPGILVFAFSDWLLNKSFFIGAPAIVAATVLVVIGAKRYWDE